MDVKDAQEKLESMQTLVLQSEKMASIGQLAAGVAHEINNPTGYVYNNLNALEKYHSDLREIIEKYRDMLQQMQSLTISGQVDAKMKERIEDLISFEKKIDIDFLMEDVIDLISDCKEGTRRIKTIVMDLKAFAHPGDETMQSTDINNGLKSTLNLANNELKYKALVKTDFGKIPFVMAIPQQLNQVFMNILVNAAQAIEKKGEISVKTREVKGVVEVVISDTGCGIPQERLTKIFDPFFTTKPVGMGTGLGMHIVRNIIEKHNGDIQIQSQEGKGTTFTVRLPVAS